MLTRRLRRRSNIKTTFGHVCDAGPTLKHHCFNVSCLLGRLSYLDDVEEVIVAEGVQNLLHCGSRYAHPQTRHAAAGVQKDHNVLRRGGRLYVPAWERREI